MNLAEALVIKRGNLFLLTPRDARLPGGREQPLGLWYRDCRFLSVHELLLDGTPPMLLQASDAHGERAVHELSDSSGAVSVRIVRTLEGPDRLRERVTLHSHGERDVRVELSLRLAADFELMLAVRGLVQRRDRYVEATAEGEEIRFAVRGRDDVLRTTTVDLSEAPASCACSDGEALLRFPVEVPAGGAREVELVYMVSEQPAAPTGSGGDAGNGRAAARLERTVVRSDDELFDRVLRRSLADLELLRSDLDGHPYYAAGVPWFATLFGRDSLIAAMQTLAFGPEVAAGTLRALGGLLGRVVDDARDEEPGKVPHELRVGEPATLGETPFARYYGSADSTPLWLCLLCDHADWTGDLDLFRDLRPQVDAAVEWLGLPLSGGGPVGFPPHRPCRRGSPGLVLYPKLGSPLLGGSGPRLLSRRHP